MGLVGFRILLLFSRALVTSALVSVAPGAPFSPCLTTQLSVLYFKPVDIVCLVLLRRLLRARGSTLAARAGFDRASHHPPRHRLKCPLRVGDEYPVV